MYSWCTAGVQLVARITAKNGQGSAGVLTGANRREHDAKLFNALQVRVRAAADRYRYMVDTEQGLTKASQGFRKDLLHYGPRIFKNTGVF